MSCCTLPINLFKRRSGKTEPPARDDEETELPARDDEEVETVEQPAASAAENPSGSPQPLEPGLDGEELEAGEQPETHGSENPPETPEPPGSGPARGDERLVLLERSGAPAPVPAPDDKSPIWSHSVKRFATEQGEKFELIKSSVDRIQDVDRGGWDTWLNQKPATSSDWIRKIRQRLPAIKTARGIATALSKLDHTGIATYIVSGVFFSLELILEIADVTMREKAMTLLLKTSIVISKWVDYEADLGRMKNTTKEEKCRQVIQQLEKRLPQIYLNCLSLISSIYKTGSTKSKRLAARTSSKEDDWDKDYKLIEENDLSCGDLKRRVELSLKGSQENMTILKWIRDRHGSEDPEPYHEDVMKRTGIKDATSEAGNWLMLTAEFKSWMHQFTTGTGNRNSVFWLKGGMGTGKTTLICRIISNFMDPPIVGVRVVHYYCHQTTVGGELKAPEYETVIRALCYQLAWNGDGSLAKPATDLYDKTRLEPDRKTTESEWEALLNTLIESSPTPIVLVIDALDECKVEDDYKRLLTFLCKLETASTTRLHCLISSQPHVVVSCGKFFPASSVQVFDVVKDQAKDDMTRFIVDQIESKRTHVRWRESIFFKEDPAYKAYKERLVFQLSRHAGGMFRWVEIWLGVFFPKNGKPVRRPEYADKLLGELENIESLDKVPDDENDEIPGNKKIKAAYEKLWEINGDGDQYKDLQSRVFHIITTALEKLTPQQLLVAASFDKKLSLDELEGLYCNFLKPNSDDRLDYEHLSAEIFVSEMKKEGFGSSTFNPHSFLARSCISHIHATSSKYKSEGKSENESGSESETYYVGKAGSGSFYEYAAKNWLYHYNEAGNQQAEISKVAVGIFSTESDSFRTWFPMYCSEGAKHPEAWVLTITNLIAASYLGLELVVEVLVKKEPNINAKTGNGWTALHWAFQSDTALAVIEKLLDGGVDPTSQDEDGETALHRAVVRGHEDVLSLLCTRGAALEMRNALGLTALHLAVRMAECMWRHDKGEKMVKVLLDHGASRHTVDFLERTPEQEAISYGRKSLVQLFKNREESSDQKLSNEEAPDPRWCFLKAGISPIMWDPGSRGRTLDMGVELMENVDSWCDPSSTKPLGVGKLLGEDIYRHLEHYLEDHVKELRIAAKHQTDKALLSFYLRQWERHKISAAQLRLLFKYLDRNWAERIIDEGRPNTFDIFNLCMVVWKRDFFSEVEGRMKSAMVENTELIEELNGAFLLMESIESVYLDPGRSILNRDENAY